ncbi:MAG: FMN-binding protein [Spirochaetales bacterium]|nr:FMN-binding protein [Spirochaetales bacterium]MBP7263386.1 FMN-binding protein [Spirochaetia bacterium]
MKKIVLAITAIAMVFAVAAVSAQAKLKDGFYFAQEDAFQSSGWLYQVVLQVKGGKIVAANWNGINNKGVMDKKTEAAEGRYGMLKASKLGKEWHEQAAAVEKYLIDTQDTAFNKYTTDAGNTDAIAGATIHVKEFFDLVKKAIAAGPVSKGSYKKDGWFYSMATTPDKSGYKATALITVVNGRIVSVNLNAVHKDGGDSKFVRAVKGTYKMNAKQGEWHIQVPRIEAEIVRLQDPSKLKVKSDGKTDAISGVSITVNEMTAVIAEALKKAK